MAEDSGNHMFYPENENQVSFETWGLKIPGDKES
jgi:hypothetical protein